MTKIELRDYGLYALPDQREFILRACKNGEYCLYTTVAWSGFEFVEYRLNREGRILSKGKPTRWRVTDLKDTGRSAESGLLARGR